MQHRTFDVGWRFDWATVYAGAFSLEHGGYPPFEGGMLGFRGSLAKFGDFTFVYEVALVATRLPGYMHEWGVRYNLSDDTFVEAGARKVYLHLPSDYLTWDGWSLRTGVRW